MTYKTIVSDLLEALHKAGVITEEHAREPKIVIILNTLLNDLTCTITSHCGGCIISCR